jgi:hypothetical protein
MALWLVDNYQVAARRACKCVTLTRSMYYYKEHSRDDGAIKMRMKGKKLHKPGYAMDSIAFLHC